MICLELLNTRGMLAHIFLRLSFKTINITLTASRKGGLTDADVKKIDNNAMLIRKYERRMKLLKY